MKEKNGGGGMNWISAFEQMKRWEEAKKKNIPESKGYLEFLDPETSGFSFVVSKNKPNVNSKNWNRSDFWYNPVAENWTVANVSGTKDYIAPSGWISFKDVAFEENDKMKIPKNSPSVYLCSSCGARHTGFHTCSKNSESGGWFSDLSNAICCEGDLIDAKR